MKPKQKESNCRNNCSLNFILRPSRNEENQTKRSTRRLKPRVNIGVRLARNLTSNKYPLQRIGLHRILHYD